MKLVIKTEQKTNMEVSSVYCCYAKKRELVQIWLADFRHAADAQSFIESQTDK